MKRLRNTCLALTMTCLALACVLGAPARTYAQAAPTAPVDVVNALATAQNANDAAAMRALIAPDAGFVQPPGSPDPAVETREEFVARNTGANNSHVTFASVQQTTADTVAVDAVLTGGGVPNLPHPFGVHVVFTVAGGLITHAVVTFSPQTAQDIAALGPAPGMPATGAGGGILPPALGLLGLLCLLAGALTRRPAPRTRGLR